MHGSVLPPAVRSPRHEGSAPAGRGDVDLRAKPFARWTDCDRCRNLPRTVGALVVPRRPDFASRRLSAGDAGMIGGRQSCAAALVNDAAASASASRCRLCPALSPDSEDVCRPGSNTGTCPVRCAGQALLLGLRYQSRRDLRGQPRWAYPRAQKTHQSGKLLK